MRPHILNHKQKKKYNERKTWPQQEGCYLQLFAAHFAHVKRPRERESYAHKETSFSPAADIKSNTTGLFHCAHSAARQLSELYCKHCAVLFLSPPQCSCPHSRLCMHLDNDLKDDFGAVQLPIMLEYHKKYNRLSHDAHSP